MARQRTACDRFQVLKGVISVGACAAMHASLPRPGPWHSTPSHATAAPVSRKQRHAPVDAVDVDPEEEKAVAERLQALRKQIAEERRAARGLQLDISLCETALEAARRDEPGLQRLAAAVEEKERLTEDVFVISHTGARMQVRAFGRWTCLLCTMPGLKGTARIESRRAHLSRPAPIPLVPWQSLLTELQELARKRENRSNPGPAGAGAGCSVTRPRGCETGGKRAPPTTPVPRCPAGPVESVLPLMQSVPVEALHALKESLTAQ